MAIEREEFNRAIEQLTRSVERGFEGVNERLDAANGKLYRHEADIAVLKDRADQSKDGHARYAGWGGVVTGAISLAWQFLHKP